MSQHRIFVNFRNPDGAMASTCIYLQLKAKFGERNVFKSCYSIPLGDSYPETLLEAAGSCDVMLAIIGPEWTSESNLARLHRPEDWVRRELATALHKGRRVIPVLLANAKMPTPATLPHDLQPVATLQYRRYSDRDAEHDLDRLAENVVELVSGLVAATPTTAVGSLRVEELDGRATAVRSSNRHGGSVRGEAEVKHVAAGGELIGVELREDDFDGHR